MAHLTHFTPIHHWHALCIIHYTYTHIRAELAHMQPTVKCTHSLGMHTLHLHAGFLMKHTLVRMYMVWHFFGTKGPFLWARMQRLIHI